MTDVLFYQNYTYVADISAIVLWHHLLAAAAFFLYGKREEPDYLQSGNGLPDDGDGLQYQFPYSNHTVTESRKILIYVVTGWDISFTDSHVCAALQLLRYTS